jgi:hypothetical protein
MTIPPNKSSTIREFGDTKTQHKIIAICWGWIVASTVLLVIYFLEIDNTFKQIFLDDSFFGIEFKSIYLFYVIDIFINGLIISFLERKEAFWGISISLFWSGFNLIENFFDIFTFRFYFHALFEELAMVCIYVFTIWLCMKVLCPPDRLSKMLK